MLRAHLVAWPSHQWLQVICRMQLHAWTYSARMLTTLQPCCYSRTHLSHAPALSRSCAPALLPRDSQRQWRD